MTKKKKSQAPKHKVQKKSRSRIQKHTPAEAKQLVCLLGDEQLVQEYSASFQSAGIAVLIAKNLSSLKNSAKGISLAFELTVESDGTKFGNLKTLDSLLNPSVPIVSSTMTSTLLLQAQHIERKERLIGISAFPTLIENRLVEIAPSLYTSTECAEKVKAFFTGIKKETAVVEDSIGLVMPRILCQVINEALFTVQNDVANPKDIDTAMKLGTNYPHGPIEWGEKIGFKNIVAVLDALYKNHGEERYRVAPLLRQMAIAGTFWKEKE